MSEEPESVKALTAQMRAASQSRASNGEHSDEQTLARIYAEFRWSIKKAGMIGQVGYADIVALLEAAVKRVQKQVKDPVLMSKALIYFVGAKQKMDELNETAKLQADVCPKCQLPKFLCPCNPQDETLKGTTP
jgi:hydroxymethylpyrimidine/phosphomethylpyrimidine kinase